MTDKPFRGILHGVTELPGYERPPVDGALCDGDGDHTPLPFGLYPCDGCGRQLADFGVWHSRPHVGWFCPACAEERK